MQAAAAKAKAVEEQRRKQQLQKKKGRTKTDKERAAAGKAAQEAAEVERRQREEEERVLREAEEKKQRQEALLALRKQVRELLVHSRYRPSSTGAAALSLCWLCACVPRSVVRDAAVWLCGAAAECGLVEASCCHGHCCGYCKLPTPKHTTYVCRFLLCCLTLEEEVQRQHFFALACCTAVVLV
jgi:hypothetical protein